MSQFQIQRAWYDTGSVTIEWSRQYGHPVAPVTTGAIVIGTTTLTTPTQIDGWQYSYSYSGEATTINVAANVFQDDLGNGNVETACYLYGDRRLPTRPTFSNPLAQILSDSVYDRALTSTDTRLFSSYDISTGDIVQNTNSWLADYRFNSIQLKPQDGAADHGPVSTLVTKRHSIAANHYYNSEGGLGTTGYFISDTGEFLTRTCVATQRVGTTDLRVLTWSEEMDITPCKVMPRDTTIFGPMGDIPLVFLNQWKQASAALTSTNDTFVSWHNPATTNRFLASLGSSTAIGGDSSDPVFYLAGESLIFLTAWGGGAQTVSNNRDAIEAITGEPLSEITSFGRGSMTRTYVLNLGKHKAGLIDLRAQLLDSTGATSGAAISTGFVDTGSGTYSWSSSVGDTFRGSVVFYSNADPTYRFCSIALNPLTTIGASSSLATVNAYVYVYDGSTPVVGATLHYQQVANTSGVFEDDAKSVTSDADGLASFEAVVGGTYRYSVNNGRFKTITIDGLSDPLNLTAVLA